MTKLATQKRKSGFERKGGLLRRNWLVLVVGFLAVVLLLCALSYWWLMPRFVDELVASIETSMSKSTGTAITHEEVRIDGLDRLTLHGVTFGDKKRPLVRFKQVQVEVDPFSFEGGMPAVLSIHADGVVVDAVRYADGTDNFTKVGRRIMRIVKPQGKGDGDGKVGRLGRILRQTPGLVMTDVTATFELQRDLDGELERARVFSFSKGVITADNPRLSLRERLYRMDATFTETEGMTTASFQADLDFGKKSVQASGDFTPPLLVSVHDQHFELKSVKIRSGEFMEAVLGRVSLINPLSNPQSLKALLGKVAGRLDKMDYLARLEAMEGKVADLRALAAKLDDRLESFSYPPDISSKILGDLTAMGQQALRQALYGTGGERLVLDACRAVYLQGKTAAGYETETYKLFVQKGTQGSGQITLKQVPENNYSRLEFALVNPSRTVRLSGELEKDGERLTVDSDLSLAMEEPYIQATASASLAKGNWLADVALQTRSDSPAFAVNTNLLLRDGQWSGSAEGTLTLPGVFKADNVRASVHEGQWSLDAGGTMILPGNRGSAEVHFSLDKRWGLKRFTATSDTDVRLEVAGYDLLIGKARLGRDAVVHLEDLAVARKGAGRDRALVKIVDLAVSLTEQGKRLLKLEGTVDLDQDVRTLLAGTVANVEIVEPVMVLRQAPTLRLPASERDKDLAQDLDDKITDALGDGSSKAVAMYEPYRAMLSSLVAGTGDAVTRFVAGMLKVGDSFPLQRVEIREGRFEYSDAVSPQDRLLAELSHFNASITKVQRPGNLGGKFSIVAGFSTPVAEETAQSSLKAEVDLATGDLTGEFKVGKVALFPYRFFLPAVITATRLTFLDDAYLGFAYATETDRFAVWGRGTLSNFNIVSSRVSRKPLEHLSLAFHLGTDAASGLQFEPGLRRLGTSAPLTFSVGALKRLRVEFTVDAANKAYPKFDFKLDLPETPVNTLLSALPRGLGSELLGLKVSGELGFTINLVGDSADMSGLKFSFMPREQGVRLEAPGRDIDFNKLSGVFKHRPPSSRHETVTVGGGSDWVPMARLSPWLILAVTTCEDGSFFRHSGFNTYQIKMSIIRDLEKGRFARGASTLTMQLMKNLFLSHEKTVARKLQEIILTWLVEKEIQKERLIEIYLNVIEWGDGVYGIKQACDFYFDGLPPENLSPAQAAFLASFVPYPRPFSKKFKAGKDVESRSRRWKRWWTRRLKIVKRIVKAMVNNCSIIDSKCPSAEPYCRIIYAACKDPGREFDAALALEALDDIFRPLPDIGTMVGESLEL